MSLDWFARRRARRAAEHGFDPDEVFLDSANLPGFERGRPEGTIEMPISSRAIAGVGLVAATVGLWFLWTLVSLQVISGESYALRAAENSLRRETTFAARGTIYDRNGAALAWDEDPREGESWSRRDYAAGPGLGSVLGYVGYPRRDARGFLYDAEVKGRAGVEAAYDSALRGVDGQRVIEETASGEVVSESLFPQPVSGSRLDLAVDVEMQRALYSTLVLAADRVGFQGGAAGLMDLKTGEVLALVSFPDYDPAVMSAGEDGPKISAWLDDPRHVFLNRATQGLYTPGSIVKPFLAVGALEEGVVTPGTTVFSSGRLEVPNPYDPEHPSIFNDWKPLGLLDLRHGIAMSSDIYFYTLGGGAGGTEGLGIDRLYAYARRFGFGEPVEDLALRGPAGVVPNQKWKAETFDGDPWRLGDTYFTAIGQYGWQVTLAQVLRAVSGVATGQLVEPTLVRQPGGAAIAARPLGLGAGNLQVVREGMRLSATEGTAKALDIPGLPLSAKTGTAELGASKRLVNSWVVGFFPPSEPRYAFAVVMERGSRDNLFGASPAFRPFLEWLYANRPNVAAGLDPDEVAPEAASPEAGDAAL